MWRDVLNLIAIIGLALMVSTLLDFRESIGAMMFGSVIIFHLSRTPFGE